MVSACESALRLVIGRTACTEKSNEITAIHALLDMVDTEDAAVTIDAMETRHTIANTIVKKGGLSVCCDKEP